MILNLSWGYFSCVLAIPLSSKMFTWLMFIVIVIVINAIYIERHVRIDKQGNWSYWTLLWLDSLIIDNKLSFDDYISKICKKINNQFRQMLSATILLRLYKAFILPHLYYCSTAWHFCGSRITDKLTALNKRILRFIHNDRDSSYCKLLEKTGTPSIVW
jgi:hypothetical protein